eukprot:383800-Pyramimonas_sp.AAC.1
MRATTSPPTNKLVFLRAKRVIRGRGEPSSAIMRTCGARQCPRAHRASVGAREGRLVLRMALLAIGGLARVDLGVPRIQRAATARSV